jgi:hypothetical protein
VKVPDRVNVVVEAQNGKGNRKSAYQTLQVRLLQQGREKKEMQA